MRGVGSCNKLFNTEGFNILPGSVVMIMATAFSSSQENYDLSYFTTEV